MTSESFPIVTQGLTHQYGESIVVENLNLQVRPGEFYGFLGQNGAGKSTTMRILCGLLRPTEGNVRVAGIDVVRQPSEVKAHIGMMMEDILLYERLSGAEFLEFVGQMHGLSRSEARRRTRELLDRMELTESAQRPISDYSLGMKKKTALSAALIHSPQILFLDEPFNGMDILSVRRLCLLLQQLVRERAITIFFTSHVMEVIERLCDRVAILTPLNLEEVFLKVTQAESIETPPLDWFA